jgi:hypothetical protein
MRVSDAQWKEQRLMVPGSYKGRGGNGGSVPVPVGEDIIEVLLSGILDRPKEAPLFERWRHEQAAGSVVWRKSERGPWKTAELTRPWHAIRELARSHSLCVATFQHRPRLAESPPYSARCKTAQHFGENDRAALREIYLNSLGRSRSGGSCTAGPAARRKCSRARMIRKKLSPSNV